MHAPDRGRFVVAMEPSARHKLLRPLPEHEQLALEAYWPFWARDEQLPPPGDWRIWLICAGRGFGKTRAGAEWVRHIAEDNPDARIALVARSIGEARAVMVEGESGVLACHAEDETPAFEPSLRRLTWPSGAQAMLYSATEAESLRGPQHSHAWCDEIAKWDNSSGRAMTAWDNLQMGLRLGEHPQVLATTTPRAVPLMRRLMESIDPDIVVTRGSTYHNAEHLPAEFIRSMKRQYGASAIGRQELNGELLADVEGALWSRSLLEQGREDLCLEDRVRTVIGVDPPASARGDACGIVVCALTESGQAKVLADASVERPSPERWARAVAAAAMVWKADRVVAEANQGGAMVESVLRAADCQMPLRLVHASTGKSARAEPVAALYEAGRVNHVGTFPQLEDELCGLMAGGDYEGPGRSPDRADALVWAMTELMLGKRGEPAVRAL
ncbi:DNA-packaging protein [Aurantiacibacter poecillastricola]|uniref:DNA-packaging protein n=1 Tax=Aurantiacibacter poecillastricola TaxID=3064385 RepID=UPI00273F8495|nr:terminase family protein [Aurantiacibacter sp. 219JJ12-13]MDP5260303.1 terminase family protein [Aurantiacibacter sp. 219JJ12-13]